ncbi:hypothetical protein D3C76_679520 [compost metagenome]
MQRRGHGEHFRARAVDAVRVQATAIAHGRARPERMLAVRGDDVQVELGFRIVPAQHHANPRRSAQVVGFIELHALERLAFGTAHFDAVGTGPECIGPGKTPLIVGVQVQRIAVDRQGMGPALCADGLELALDHRAIALHTAIDGGRGIGDLRVFGTVEQTVEAPAAHRLRQLGTRRGQGGRTGPADQQQKK